MKIANQPKLDGIDLQPVIAGKQTERPPMGFWHGHTSGQGTWSDRIIKALKEAKESGNPNPHPERILKNVEEFPTFGADAMRGHAAWNAWPWKLHRKEKESVSFEVYNLVDDPMEATDLAKNSEYEERLHQMQTDLAYWQLSVTRSLNGKDYP